MSSPYEIGAYEAKTHLSAYLRGVQEGHSYIITQRGQPIAELLPHGLPSQQNQVKAARQMQAFIDASTAPTVDIKALLDEGRD